MWAPAVRSPHASETDHTRAHVRHPEERPLAADAAPAGAAAARATERHVDVPVAGAVVDNDLTHRHVLDEAVRGGHVPSEDGPLQAELVVVGDAQQLVAVSYTHLTLP